MKWLSDETIEIIEQLKMARIQQQVVAFIWPKFFLGQFVTNVNIVITSDKWTLLYGRQTDSRDGFRGREFSYILNAMVTRPSIHHSQELKSL